MSTLNADALDGAVFISDNLPFLKSLDTESVDLVCIDPPFGKRQTFVGTLKRALSDEERRIERDLMDSWGVYDPVTAYELGIEYPDQSGRTASFNDIWDFRVRVYEDWLTSLESACPPAYWLIQSTRHTHSDSTAAYIAFMVERMLEIRRVLKHTGSVFLHCDNEANAYLRQMMDAVFGQDNFRNEIVWKRATSRKIDASRFGNTHDTILFYSKSASYTYNTVRLRHSPEYVSKMYRHDDDDGRGPYRVSDLTQSGWTSGESGMDWRGVSMKDRNKHWITPTGKGLGDWIVANVIPNFREIEGTLARLDALDEHNLIYWPKRGSMPGLKRYFAAVDGPAATDIFEDLPPLQGSAAEYIGYPTQKPQALARRIIEAASNPGDMVLDCFAGCAYVPVAAQILGRRWIACDMSPRAWTVVRRQFHKHPNLGIVTEGEIPKDEGVESQFENLNRVIRVRGPSELPTRTTPDEQASLAAKTLPELEYKMRPHESSQSIWEAFVDHWGPECWYCGAVKSRDRRELQLDHVEPNKWDGSNDDCWNRAIACSPCNSDKSDRLTSSQTIEYALEAGRIATHAKMKEIKRNFTLRRKWAKARWDEIKPRQLV